MIDPAALRERNDKPEWMIPDWHSQHAAHVERCMDAVKSGETLSHIFIGDSITFAWQHAGEKDWRRYFAHDSLNLAIGGDSTGHLLWRLHHNPHLKQLRPKRIVCLIGTNNIGNDGQNENEVLAGVRAVIEKVKLLFPRAAIHLLAIFPRGRLADHALRQIVDKSNDLLKPLAKELGVIFTDCNATFLNQDQSIPEATMPDELHLSPAGYALLAPALMKAMQ